MSSSTQQWVNDELSTLELGDKRRDQRARSIVKLFAARPGGTVPPMCDSAAEVKAVYRFLSNDDIEPDQITAALGRTTAERIAEHELVVVAQDTTSLDFSTRPATEGLGPTGGGDGSDGHGMFAHSAIAISDDGVPLGLLHQQVWSRDPDAVGVKHQRKERAIEDKESYRWLQTATAVEAAVPDSVTLIQVADREGDIFELFAQPRSEGSHLLIRAAQNRRVEAPQRHLWEQIEAVPPAAEFEILVRQSPHHTTRKARVQLSWCAVTVRPPEHGKRDPALEPVTLSAVLVTEPDAPERVTPLRWLLLTDLPVADAGDAMTCLRYYQLRWLIERYHFVLKSGCRIEDSQLRSFDALRRLLALFSAVALRLLWIMYSCRADGDQPCTVAFSDVEWQVLYRQSQLGPLPERPPPLRDVVLWTAKLGGFIARKGDGEPGVKVLWRGLMRLQDITIGFLLLTQDVGNA